ncbi:unnamed protein product [Urochloa decumbens]|uniref:RWP-RK domain-containing protein n=1 Tax=Urochloa decumbens TaxID=240449 RepID=A0ABC9CBS1_9POAL
MSQPVATEPTAAELAPSVQKQPRANRKRVHSIALVDIAQYFHLPIKEASKALEIGVSALKGKCRKYGIPRWPHRKIKSLNSLIHDLEYVLTTEDADQEWLQNKDAAVIKALTEQKRLLESEKETIWQKPSLDLTAETKLFRQAVFKRRHNAQISARG